MTAKLIITSAVTVAALSATSSILPVFAADNPGAHEHGAATLDFAIEDSLITAWFTSPSVNLVGFEHAPGNEEQKKAIDDAIAALKDFNNVMSIPADLGCEVESSRAQWVQKKQAEHAEHGKHEEHEEHEEHGKHEEHHGHEEHETAAAHSEFQAEYKVRCDQADIETIPVPLFDIFQGIERVDVRGVVASGQVAQRLTPENSTITLD